MSDMIEHDPFRDFVENGLNLDALDALAADHDRRRREAINELLHCLEELKDILDGYSPYGRIPPKDRRD